MKLPSLLGLGLGQTDSTLSKIQIALMCQNVTICEILTGIDTR